MEISIIITAHSEGILLHRTLRSAIRASQLLDNEKISWELLIHVDNATSHTLDYINANQDFLKPYQIFYNSFKDLSASRNFMVKKAKGSIITFLDADDLISENWFAEGYTYLQKQTQPTILHTEWLVNFGKQSLVWQKYDSRSKEEDALIMVWANRWDSAVMARREIFEQFPYAPNTHGYGSEDWHFGSQTLAADIAHRVVPQTVIFARRKDISEMSIQQTDFRTVHYTNLLDIKFVKSINIDAFQLPTPPRLSNKLLPKVKNLTFRVARRAYRTGSGIQALQPFLTFAKQKVDNRKNATEIPAWLLVEWRAMHAIDKQVFPDTGLIKNIPKYVSEMYELGVAYRNMLQYISKQPDYIVIIPHLVAGGADLVVLNYVRVLQKLHPEWHILVIATDNTPSPWAQRLPEAVDYLPWGQVCDESGLWLDLHLQLFARLIVQLRCKRLHIIQSSLGFRFADKYKSLLSQNNYTVYACAFCEDIDDEGRFIGHVHSGLPGAYPQLTHIFTDNQAIADQMVYEYGHDLSKYTVHYQPAEIDTISVPTSRPVRAPFRILWASRVTTQKRPDILRDIGMRLNPDDYHIDVYGSLHNGFTANYFSEASAITYVGGFNGIESIDTSAYDMFLYTSSNDGVPNILLGVTAAGLPVVASNAGGVREFIRSTETGLLIENVEDIDGYIEAIEFMKKNPEKAVTFCLNAQSLLTERHSEQAFQKEVEKAQL